MITLEAIPDPKIDRAACVRHLNNQRLVVGNDETGLYAMLVSADGLAEVRYVITWNPGTRAYGISIVETFDVPDDGVGGPGSDTTYSYLLRKSHYSYHEYPEGKKQLHGHRAAADRWYENWSQLDKAREQMLCDIRNGEQPVVQVVGERVYRLLGRNACKVGVMKVAKKIRENQPDALEQYEVVLLIPARGFTSDKKQVRYLASPIDGCWSDGEDHEWNDGVHVDPDEVTLLFQD